MNNECICRVGGYTLFFGAWAASHSTETHEHKQTFHSPEQGCQVACFQTKNPNLGKFWRALDWNMLIFFMVIWNILRTFGIFYGHLGFL
jgi:hypothetical protein